MIRWRVLIVDQSLSSTSRVLGWRAFSLYVLLGYQLLPQRKSDDDLQVLIDRLLSLSIFHPLSLSRVIRAISSLSDVLLQVCLIGFASLGKDLGKIGDV
jgi:hypothetical protein